MSASAEEHKLKKVCLKHIVGFFIVRVRKLLFSLSSPLQDFKVDQIFSVYKKIL